MTNFAVPIMKSMKKLIFFLLLTGCCWGASGKTASLRAYLSYSTFYSPEHGPYLETYLSIQGKSLTFIKNDNGKFQGSVLVTMIFKQNDSIKDFRKYELFSPEIDDTTSMNFSFLDQQRIPLPVGKYLYELTLDDKNADNKPLNIAEDLLIHFPQNEINVSGIELVESFQKADPESTTSKSGYDFIPYLDNYFPSTVNKLVYYAEIYNTVKILTSNEPFVVITSIQSFETGKVISSYQKVKRETSKTVNVVFGEFDISNLPSGNFNLMISVRNKENQQIASNSLFFQRSNPNAQYDLNDITAVDTKNSFVSNMNDLEILRENVRCLYPISSATEKLFIRSQLKTANLEILQKYFLTFWSARDVVSPEAAWNKYYEQVQIANQLFKCVNMKGYETDRGRVFLQYGAPNAKAEDDRDPSKRPYEIWHYYKAGKETNRKFVFYCKDIALACYEIIHSDVTGELYNPWWQQTLTGGALSRDPYYDYVRRPSEKEDDYWGGHSSDYYNIPR
jgi:GWxTD domain-containing protein